MRPWWLLLALLAAGAAPSQAAPQPLRVLYAGDWTGHMEIFAADASGRTIGQVTFGDPGGGCHRVTACGYTDPLPSPDGKRLAYWSFSDGEHTLWLARADGSAARAVATAATAAWSPDSRSLAYAGTSVHVLGTKDRVVLNRVCSELAWAPDGKTLAAQCGGEIKTVRGARLHTVAAGGVSGLTWSPDGTRIAYGTMRDITVVTPGQPPRTLFKPRSPVFLFRVELAWSPNGRTLALNDSTVRLLDLRTKKIVDTKSRGHHLAWSPDGSRLLFVAGEESTSGDSMVVGDLKTATVAGRVSTLVPASRAYAGQLAAAAWTRGTLRYRPTEKVDGAFAGGPVQEIAAEGGRVAFVACGGVSVWTVATGAVDAVMKRGECDAPFSREHTHSLGLAGDRTAWVEKTYGLCFQWQARTATLGSAPTELAHGTGCLGSPPPEGVGTAVGSGSLLVVSRWSGRTAGPFTVTSQSIQRVGGGVISSSPGPYTPLDVDGGRVVVSGTNETRVLASDGTVLRSLQVPTLAAQLDGDTLALVEGRTLRLYSVSSGGLLATDPFPLPDGPVGHDCDYYGDPSCQPTPKLTIGGLSHGWLVYVVSDNIYALRLGEWRAYSIGRGTLARFTDTGLVYADGARIHLLPFARIGA